MEIQKELNHLKSLKSDIEKRLQKLSKGKEEAIQKKIQNFLIKVLILESSLDKSSLPEAEYFKVLHEVLSLKSSGEYFQSSLNRYPGTKPSRTNEDEILENLKTLKEISNTILSELQDQNKLTQKSLKSIESNQEIILKAKARLNRLETFLDCLPTSCLILTLLITFLSTILILSIF